MPDAPEKKRVRSGKREAASITFAIGLVMVGGLFATDDASRIQALMPVVQSYVWASIGFMGVAFGLHHLSNVGAFWR